MQKFIDRLFLHAKLLKILESNRDKSKLQDTVNYCNYYRKQNIKKYGIISNRKI